MLVLGTSCFVQSPVMTFGGGKSAKEAQQDLATKSTPPTFSVDAEWSGPVTTAKIRVLADDDYRSQNIHWQQTFQEELDYANELLAAQFGVRLEAEYRAWSYHDSAAPLEEKLAALSREDPGQGVLTVVGLTSSQGLVAATFDHIGVGSMPGNHLIVRGYADVGERKAFEVVFRDLRREERDALYIARRRHKTAAVLLHELGHNLGAPHRQEPDTLMSAVYSDHSSGFDASSRERIMASLDARLGRPPRAEVHAVSSSPVAVPQDAHPTLVIVVDAAGRRLVGGNALDDATLEGLLRLSYEDDHETSIVIQHARTVPIGIVTKVLQLAKQTGLQRVSVNPADP